VIKTEWGEKNQSIDAFDLTGKRALIIGADNPAGRAIALAFAQAGADVTCSSTTNDGEAMLAAKKVSSEITALGRKSWTVGTDVTLGTGVQVMVRQVAKDMGAIDLLVNAPDLFLGKAAAETTDVEFNRVMQVNLAGTFHACRAVGKEMLRNASPSDQRPTTTRTGTIINVASVLGERGLANAAAYCAAHAGILNLTRALAQEWSAHGITVNAIAQGWMEHTPAIGNPDPEANQTVRFVPMKRAGRADELAGAALYLASDATGYVTGQVLYVDGGLTTHL
jgi:NAD(P)-dependent dehydrogenase (short-subunit alcohol dehydrogenase family)